MASIITTKTLTKFLRELEANGCTTRRDRAAGIAEAKDGDKFVLRAIQKGHSGPWIARFLNSDRITWTQPDRP